MHVKHLHSDADSDLIETRKPLDILRYVCKQTNRPFVDNDG